MRKSDYPKWQEWEERFVMETYPDPRWSIKQIAQKIERTRDAVKVRARFCGVKRPTGKRRSV